MKSQIDHLVFVVLFLILQFQVIRPMALFSEASDCPMDCICYPDYLDNLESWKWIETDVNVQLNDPENPDFNPYTEHNEVYDNPNIGIRRQKSSQKTLKTVTCIIRNDHPSTLSSTIELIPADTQVLSILQAQGSGNITVTMQMMEKFSGLIGLELQGVSSYHDGNSNERNYVNTLRLNANALVNNKKLRYLNLEKVLIEQRTAEKEVEQEDVYIKVRPKRDGSDSDNEIEEQQQPLLLYLGVKEKDEPTHIIPYSEYKKEQNDHHQDTNMYSNSDNSLETLPLSKQSSTTKQDNVFLQPKIAVGFTSLDNLVHLRISGCNMQDLSWDMFYKLSSLKFLVLDKNDLLFLPDFTFFSTPNLTALSLSGNRILNLQTVGLAGLLYLEKLDVTNNNITHLSELSLPPFPHLQVADFRNNPIESIFPNTFEIMNSTKSLYIGNPSVSLEFYANSFYGLISLTKLEMINVKIGALERAMLKGMPQLETLIIVDGSIPRILYDAFNDVPNLEKLVLKRCQIYKISMDALYNLNSLQELDLSHNRLEVLAPGVFDGQVNSLRELYLHHNLLTTLPSNLFNGLLAIKMIRLEANPWHCSCDMDHWNSSVINMVKRYHIPRNLTNCHVQYDKGSMCNNIIGPQSFQPKYVYEKRVSPVCNTPIQYAKKTVFQFLQKGFVKCNSHKKVRKVPKVKKSNKNNNNNNNSTAISENASSHIPREQEQQLKRLNVTSTNSRHSNINRINSVEESQTMSTDISRTTVPTMITTSTITTTTTSVPNSQNNNNNNIIPPSSAEKLSKYISQTSVQVPNNNNKRNSSVNSLLGLQTRLKNKMASRFDTRRNSGRFDDNNSISRISPLSSSSSSLNQKLAWQNNNIFNNNLNSQSSSLLPSPQIPSTSNVSKKSLKMSKLMRSQRTSQTL